MPWDFKNDPFLRTILVILIGILGFGLFFNYISGGGTTMGGENMDSMNSYGSYGNSLGGFVSGLLSLLVNILIIVLVIALVAGVIIWIKNTFFRNTNTKFMQSINNDPILKTVAIVTLVILGIVLLTSLLGSFGQYGMSGGGHMGNYNYSYSYGYGLSNSITGILLLLVKVLMFVLVISLIMAVVSYLKNQYDQGNLKFFGTNSSQGMNPGNTGSTGSTGGTVNNSQDNIEDDNSI